MSGKWEHPVLILEFTHSINPLQTYSELLATRLSSNRTTDPAAYGLPRYLHCGGLLFPAPLGQWTGQLTLPSPTTYWSSALVQVCAMLWANKVIVMWQNDHGLRPRARHPCSTGPCRGAEKLCHCLTSLLLSYSDIQVYKLFTKLHISPSIRVLGHQGKEEIILSYMKSLVTRDPV